MVGIALGMYMGIAADHRLRHVHVHINLLGWVSLCLMALIYQAMPQLQRGWIPLAHFWAHNLGLPMFMGGIAYMQISGDHFIPPVVIGSTLLAGGIVLWSLRLIVELLRKE